MLRIRTASLAAMVLFSFLAAARGQGGEETGSIAGRVVHARVRENTPAIVYLEAISDRTFDPPAEDGELPAIDQMDQTFEPHVLAVQAGSRVAFPNSDVIRHNVYSPEQGSVQAFDLGSYRPGETKFVVFERAGIVPLKCSIHSDMSAWIVVCPTPFFATTDETGAFRIEGVPPGAHRLTVWHEKLAGRTIDVSVEVGKTAEIEFRDLEEVE
ncbi:MAG: carboxypeptidase regulatory-like domain-containing protein [Planctomycetes bacterium]|nr:carboxypeptidase regulatory-like domain-containing protein [Planctomycetota bacterium]